FPVSPDMLERMAMVGRKPRLRQDRFDRFGAAWGGSRAGRGHMETERLASSEKLPGIVPMLCGRFMRHADAIRLLLDHHHTLVSPQRVGAVKVTLRRRGEGQALP